MDYQLSDFEKDFDPNENYFDEEEDELSFAHTLYTADAGNAEYMRLLGDVYSRNGYGVKTDYNKAIYWYQRAVDCGDVPSQWKLAELFYEYDKKGIPQDCKRAFELYSLAADNGIVVAISRLGVMRRYGLGCAQDKEQARTLLRRAADENEREAMYEYALLLQEEGAPEWFDMLKKSADKGYGKACMQMLKTAKELTDKQYYLYLIQAANDYSYGYDCAEAQFALAEGFMHGTRMKQNKDNAKTYYARAAENGNAQAKEALKKYFGEE